MTPCLKTKQNSQNCVTHSELKYKLWILLIIMYQYWFINSNQFTLLMEGITKGGKLGEYLFAHFSYRFILRIKSLKKGLQSGKVGRSNGLQAQAGL